MTESQLLPGFLSDIFDDVLGYTEASSGRDYTLKREALVEVDGKRADAVIGRFGLDGARDKPLVVVEGKGPQDPLDEPFAGRKRSAVEQAQKYALNLRVDWYMVTNLRELRLYHKGHDEYSSSGSRR